MAQTTATGQERHVKGEARPKILNGGARFRWSFGPNSADGHLARNPHGAA